MADEAWEQASRRLGEMLEAQREQDLLSQQAQRLAEDYGIDPSVFDGLTQSGVFPVPLLKRFKKQPAYPPEELFKMPRYSEKVVAPAAFTVLKDKAKEIGKRAINIGQEAINDTKSKIKDLDYIYPNPYEGLINEAVLDHLRKYGR